MSRAFGAALFAAGAIIGSGLTAFITQKRRDAPVTAPISVQAPVLEQTKAIVQAEPLGGVALNPQLGRGSELLKYGHPGTS